MKGYQKMEQFIDEYSLYLIAQKIETGKEGETLTDVMKDRIAERIKYASQRFRRMMDKEGYSLIDLRIIAIHDSINYMKNLDQTLKELSGTIHLSPAHIRFVLKSRAFRSGRLTKINYHIPAKVSSKEELFQFIKRNQGFHINNLHAVMKIIAPREYVDWLEELVDNKIVALKGWGCYI